MDVAEHLVVVDEQPPIAVLDPIPSSPPPKLESDVAVSVSVSPAKPISPLPSAAQETRPRKLKIKPQVEERAKGHTSFPLARVQRIIKSERQSTCLPIRLKN